MALRFSNGGNRILPANTRAVDVARAAIDAVSDVQRTRLHNAIAVQGSPVCVYHRLTSGQRCHCQDRKGVTVSNLTEDGHATQDFLNSLLTGNTFGIRNYATTPLADLPPTRDPSTPSRSLFSIDTGDLDDVSGLYDEPRTPIVGAPFDTYSSDASDMTSTVIGSGVGANGVIPDSGFEDVIIDSSEAGPGATDAACPICFGTGYIGGFSIFNGFRLVLTHQHATANYTQAVTYFEDVVPVSKLDPMGQVTFTVVLPVGAVSVDALRVWNGSRPVTTARIHVDGVRLGAANDILRYFDGRSHVFRVSAPDAGLEFTHVELQTNHSVDDYHVDFPEVSRGSSREEFDALQEVQLVASPMIPMIRPDDFLADGVHRKVFQITSATQSSDKRLRVMGWKCDARVVQPQELLSMLPRRTTSPIPTPHNNPLVRDNARGHRRT